MTVDELPRKEKKELEKIQADESPKSPAEDPPKNKDENKKYERIRAGRAVRMEYEIDEGSGRLARHDQVFVIDADGNVIHRLNTEDFRLGKPNDRR